MPGPVAAATSTLAIAPSDLEHRRSVSRYVCPFLALCPQQQPTNRGKRRRTISSDYANVYKLSRCIRRRAARARNAQQTACFSPVNRRVAGSNPARGANSSNSLQAARTRPSVAVPFSCRLAYPTRGIPRGRTSTLPTRASEAGTAKRSADHLTMRPVLAPDRHPRPQSRHLFPRVCLRCIVHLST
jgi:hypothetical protein